MAAADLRRAPAGRIARLTESLRQAGHQPLALEPWRGGVDYWVDLASFADGSVRVVRSPRVEAVDTSYDGPTDFGQALVREAVVLRLAERAGVPVPHVYDQQAGDPPWMLQSLLTGDDTPPAAQADRQIGVWVRRLHEQKPTQPPFAPAPGWSGWVANRIGRRLAAMSEFTTLPATAEVLATVAELLPSRNDVAVALLHLDVRPDNIVYAGGMPIGLLDFANALTGDPLFELARIRRYGGLTTEFSAGYGELSEPAEVLQRLLDFYELDSSTLLTVVGRHEADDEQLHRVNLARTHELCRQLLAQR